MAELEAGSMYLVNESGSELFIPDHWDDNELGKNCTVDERWFTRQESIRTKPYYKRTSRQQSYIIYKYTASNIIVGQTDPIIQAALT